MIAARLLATAFKAPVTKRPPPKQQQSVPFYLNRGRRGMAILALIALIILFGLLWSWGAWNTPATPASGSFTVRISPFIAEGGEDRTGIVVADHLVQTLSERVSTPMNLARLRTAITAPEAAIAALDSSGADAIIWGSVASGATADAPALRPRLTWRPRPTWPPARWVGIERWSFPRHYELAKAPLNGSAVLPSLLDGLALLQAGEGGRAQNALAALGRDYGDVVNAELPATLEALIFWGQGRPDLAEEPARAAVAAQPRGESWNNLGVVLLAAEAGEDARDAWSTALALDPQLVQAHANHGRYLLLAAEPSAAIPDLEAAVAGGDEASRPVLVTALRRAGRLERARELATVTLQRRPHDPVALTERAFLALTDVPTTTGRLEWELEERPPDRTLGELAELRSQMTTVRQQTIAARTTALQQAAAHGAAGNAALQQIAETQARGLYEQQMQQRYVLVLIEIEQGRLTANENRNTFSRFWSWLRGERTVLQEAAALAAADQAPADDEQLRYDLLYQAGRAAYLGGDGDEARRHWEAAAALTNTPTLARQPEVLYGQARLLLDQQQPGDARPLFEEALAIAPNYTPARRELLTLAQKEGRWEETEQHLRWLLTTAPSPSLRLELVEVLRRQERYADAEALLLPLANSGDVDALTALGSLYRAAGQLDQAERVLQQALGVNPEHAPALEELAAVVEARPPPDLAVAEGYLRQAIAADGGRYTAHLALAQLLDRQGRPAEAAREFQAAVAIQSDDPQVYRRLGEALLQSGQPGPAADGFRRAIELDPNSHEAHHGLAMANLEQGRLGDARAEEDRALAIANNYTPALVGLGDIAFAEGNYAEATERYQAALEQDRRIAGAYQGLARTASAQGAREVALGHYRSGLEADPNDIVLLLGFGDLQLQSGDLAGAEATFRRVLSVRQNSAAAFRGLGQSLWRQGRSDEARIQLQEAVAHDPGDADSWLALGEINATTGQLQDALDSYTQAAKARPDWHEPHFRRGVLLLENNQPTAAVDSLQAAVRLNDAFAQGHYWLGRAYRATAQWADAERQLRRAAELDPNYYEARLFLGRVLDERGKGEEAISVFQALLDEAPTDNPWRAEAERDLAR